jgi:hypothetical protein
MVGLATVKTAGTNIIGFSLTPSKSDESSTFYNLDLKQNSLMLSYHKLTDFCMRFVPFSAYKDVGTPHPPKSKRDSKFLIRKENENERT